MNDTQTPAGADAGSAAPADAVGTDSAAAAPKPRRARKTASVAVAETAPAPEAGTVAAAAPAASDEAPKPRRSRARKTAASTDADPAAAVSAAPEAAPVAVPVETVAAEAAEPAAKPKRAPRRRAASEAAPADAAVVVAEAVPEAAPVEGVAALAAEPAAAAESDVGSAAAAADGAAADDADNPANKARESTRRRRDRQRSRLRQAAEQKGADQPDADAAMAEAAVDAAAAEPAREEAPGAGIFSLAPQPEKVDVGARFADVLSGDYDSDAEAGAEEAEAEVGKRVLRPEPEAPKLHKVLAQAGIGSRRDMEQLIQDGQVTVNGEVAHLGMRITYGDQIKVGGQPVRFRIAPPAARVLAYHKPVGEVVTLNDPEGRPTVFRRLPRLQSGKWQSVGRLDINTEGLLLFTTSGELANQLMHPRFNVEREYAVRVLGTLAEEQRNTLLAGVEIEGQKAAFKSIENGGGEGVNHWYRVVITEGRNREVRKLFDSVGLAVSRLIRIRYGCVVLPRGLKRGVWVELDEQDVTQIRQLAAPAEAPRQPQGRGEGLQPRDGQPPRGGQKQQGAQGQRQGGQGGQPQGRGNGNNGKGQGQRKGGAAQFGQVREARDGRDGREARPDHRPDQRAEARPEQRNDRAARDEDDVPLRIPNPLEQTFDRRFAASKRISAGFGRPSEEGSAPQGSNRNKGGPKQPDPLQTSVGYIGADAYFTKPGGNRGGNRGGGGRSGGGGGYRR